MTTRELISIFWAELRKSANRPITWGDATWISVGFTIGYYLFCT